MMISFRNGQPQESRLPMQLLTAAATKAVQSPDWLQYGPSAGEEVVRAALARFLTPHYRYEVQPAHLFISSGVSHGLGLVATALLRPGDVVVVENPTYFLVRGIFDDVPGVKVVGVSTDSDGMVVDELEQLVADDNPVRLVYTIPIHHNPTGVTLSHPRREQLVRLATKHNFTIVADEVYQLLTFPTAPLPPKPMLSYDTSDCVVSLSSFSKILCPGLRVGWVETRDPNLMNRLENNGVIVSGGCGSHLASSIALQVIQHEQHQQFEEYVHGLATLYEHRCQVLMDAIQQHLPAATLITRPQGGYFLYVRVPNVSDRSVQEIDALLQTQNVRVLMGHDCYIGDDHKHHQHQQPYVEMRLCFARLEDSDMIEGVRRIAATLNGLNSLA